jgi:hypothetical protein
MKRPAPVVLSEIEASMLLSASNDEALLSFLSQRKACAYLDAIEERGWTWSRWTADRGAACILVRTRPARGRR